MITHAKKAQSIPTTIKPASPPKGGTCSIATRRAASWWWSFPIGCLTTTMMVAGMAPANMRNAAAMDLKVMGNQLILSGPVVGGEFDEDRAIDRCARL
jgi:hypothetical protein